jgi:hypothetical protein
MTFLKRQSRVAENSNCRGLREVGGYEYKKKIQWGAMDIIGQFCILNVSAVSLINISFKIH